MSPAGDACKGDVAAESRLPADAATAAVVGTAPAELESIKELIRFDHVYYKPEVISTCSPSPRDVTPQTTASLDADSSSQTTLTVKEECVDTTNVVDNMDFEIDLNDIMEFGEHLEELINFDNLLTSGGQDSDDVIVISDDNDEPPSTLSEENVACAQPTKAETTLPDDCLDFVLSRNQLSISPDSYDLLHRTPASVYDGYGSEGDMSDMALSPKSDVSSSLDRDDMWGESFMELFPSLL